MINSLVQVLETVCNGTGGLQEAAMLQLQGFESHEGYISGLCSVTAERSFSADIRLMAAISLKNVVGRCWGNKRGEQQVRVATDSEKCELRAFVIRNLDEADKKVSRQLSALASKIARADWPEQWPELLPTLFHAAACGVHTPNTSVRALHVLNEVLDELRTKQLPGPRKALAAASLAAFPDFLALWSGRCDSAARRISELTTALQFEKACSYSWTEMAETKTLLVQFAECTVVIHKLLERSFAELARTDFALVRSFFSQLAQQMGQLAAVLRMCLLDLRELVGDEFSDSDGSQTPPCASDDGASGGAPREVLLRALSSLIQQALKELVKIPVDLQKTHPVGMTPLVGPFLSFFHEQLRLECEQQGRLAPFSALFPFRISALLFLSNSISCREYEEGATSQNSEVQAAMLLDVRLQGATHIEDSSQALAAARHARDAFFRGETAVELLDMSLRHFLPYGRADLEEWSSDPEQFYSQLQAQQEDDTVRSAAEGLVLGLLSHASCGGVVTKRLVTLLNDVNAQAAAAGVGAPDADVALWDSAFLCAGLGAYSVGQLIDATTWLRSILGPLWGQMLSDAQAGALQTGQQVLRHRLLWLLRCWFYQFDAACHTDLFGLAVSVLNPANRSDLVVSMEACLLVETALDTCVLKPEALGPVLAQLIEALVFLCARLTQPELQATVVGVITKLVQCMGYAIKPLVPALVHQISLLWQQSDASSPLRPGILEALTELAKAARGSVESLADEMAPLIALACSGTTESSFLMKEGISLWLSLMRNLTAGSYSQALDSTFRVCLDGVFSKEVSDLSADELRELMLVCEAYATLGKQQCLVSNAESLHRAFRKLLCEVSPRSVVYVVRPLEAFFLTCPVETSQFLAKDGLLLLPLCACAASTKDFGPLFEKHKEADVAIIMYISIVARLLLVDPRMLAAACEAVVLRLPEDIRRNCKITGTSLFYAIVRLMLDKFDVCEYSRGGLWRRKLWVLALLSLYPDHAALWQWFPEVTRLAAEVEKESAGKASHELVQSMTCEDAEEEEHEDRASRGSSGDAEGGASEMQREEERLEALGSPFSINFKELLNRDMVQATHIADYAAKQYALLRGAAGESQFNQILDYTYTHT